jgi:hypothetical protein
VAHRNSIKGGVTKHREDISALPVHSDGTAQLLIHLNFSVRDDGNIFSGLEELHNRLAFPGQFRPSGFGVRILLQAAQFSTFESEIYLFQFALGRLPNRTSFAVNLDGFLFVDQTLLPDGQKNGFETPGHKPSIAPNHYAPGDRWALAVLKPSRKCEYAGSPGLNPWRLFDHDRICHENVTSIAENNSNSAVNDNK